LSRANLAPGGLRDSLRCENGCFGLPDVRAGRLGDDPHVDRRRGVPGRRRRAIRPRLIQPRLIIPWIELDEELPALDVSVVVREHSRDVTGDPRADRDNVRLDERIVGALVHSSVADVADSEIRSDRENECDQDENARPPQEGPLRLCRRCFRLVSGAGHPLRRGQQEGQGCPASARFVLLC
jgi:hypothetical protein